MLEEQKYQKTVDEESWIILVEMDYDKCPERFRKWRPPQNGYFCRLTSDVCNKKFCKRVKGDNDG